MNGLGVLVAWLLIGAVSRAADGTPLVMDLSMGQSREVRLTGLGGQVQRRIRLVSVREHYWPNWHLANASDHRVFQSAEVEVEVNGTFATLWARPFESPRAVNGLRLFVETTRDWAGTAQLDPLPAVEGDVRLSCVAEGMAWGPSTLRFPIRDYRWQANTYRNTWSALVPYNLLYYHRGEDFGAIPDELEVLASLGGTVSRSPLPKGDGDSNGIEIQHDSGLLLSYYHMNLDMISAALTNGSEVIAGQVMGRTGMTWAGRRSQDNDPHLHWGVSQNGRVLGSFPYLLEAYLRDYPDSVLAMAGGYQYAMPGDFVRLDASRTVARPGRRVVQYRWILHDGREVEGERVTLRAEEPGLYSEELRVRADDGSEDRDYVQLRVWDAERGGRVGAGWFYHSPIRGIRPGHSVRFWNRLWGAAAPVTIDFGDGSPAIIIDRESTHTYEKSGTFTARLQTRGPGDEPMEVRMRVVVE